MSVKKQTNTSCMYETTKKLISCLETIGKYDYIVLMSENNKWQDILVYDANQDLSLTYLFNVDYDNEIFGGIGAVAMYYEKIDLYCMEFIDFEKINPEYVENLIGMISEFVKESLLSENIIYEFTSEDRNKILTKIIKTYKYRILKNGK